MTEEFAIVSGVDFGALFTPTVPLLETFLRGTVVYLGLFVMLRLLLKRESSQVGVTDLLVVVLLADAAQNAMSANYESITDGLLLVAVIIAWSYVLDWLSYRFSAMNRLIKPEKLLLVRNGQMLRDNMRKELITEDELMSELRRYGIGKLDEVEFAYMEPNGGITAIPKHGRRNGRRVERKRPF